MTKEEAAEQEKLRQEAIRQAERERREKYKRQEDEREGIRQSIRDKVTSAGLPLCMPCFKSPGGTQWDDGTKIRNVTYTTFLRLPRAPRLSACFSFARIS